MAREDAWEMPQGLLEARPLVEILVSKRTRQGFRKMTYEYLCAECQHAWEEEQSISASPTETCPNCGHKSAKRQVSGGVGFILKGGGWYADGYGSGSSKKSADSPSDKSGGAKTAGSTSEPAKSGSTKSESSGGDSKSGDSPKGDSGKGGGASGDSAASPPA